MPDITIDGPNKVIDIGFDSGTTTVDVSDIYSRWKDWVKAGNAQYLPAFAESVGGNDLGGGVTLDGYYFLRNDLGWRVRAADFDHTLIVNGQLFGFSPAIAVFLSRPGRTINYRTILSSRSQVVSPDADAVQASGSYQGRVFLDPSSAFGGTDFPNGTSVQPVNNIADAVSIANSYGLKEIYLLGSVSITENVAGYTISNADKGISVIVNDAAVVTNTLFDGVNVTGYFDGIAYIRNGIIDELISGFQGHIDDCHITTGIVCNGDVSIYRCSSDVAGAGGPYIDLDGLPINVQIRDWFGSVELRNMVAGSVVSVDLSAGRVIVNGSCTGGLLKIRGIGERIEDNSGLVAMDLDGLVIGDELTRIRKVLVNRRETDPSTGQQRIYDDDDATVLIEGDIFEDVDGTTPYGPGSQKIDRADRMQ